MIEIGRDSISGRLCIHKGTVHSFGKNKTDTGLLYLTVSMYRGNETTVQSFKYDNTVLLDTEYYRLKSLLGVA